MRAQGRLTDLSVVFPEVTFQRQALDVKAMPFERWLRLMQVLERIEDSTQFWIGDGLNAGERAYGEKYSQAINQGQADRWRHYAWVARSVCLRKHISYKHHEAVAPLDPKDQAKWLDEAIANKWSVHE